MVALRPTPAYSRLGRTLLTTFTQLAATLVGISCHDAVAPRSLGPSAPTFTIVSGDGQTAPAGSELTQPLVARATNSSGGALAGITVSFVVTQGGGKLYAGTGVTNSTGDIQDYWTLGSGVGQQKVEVRAVDPTTGVKNSYATFTATAVAGPAAVMKLVAGDGQSEFTRALVPTKPAVLVTDAFGNPVGGVAVTFRVTAGGGSISGSPATTNTNGVATLAYWRLGRGPGANKVSASSGELAGSPVTFTASAKFGLRLVATGSYHSCGLSAANDVYCWGHNAHGQVGDGTLVNRSAPVRVAATSLLLPPSLALGEFHSCGLLTTGKVQCWGRGSPGSLGDGTSASSSTPVTVSGSQVFTRIAAANYATCGVTAANEVYCWGRNVGGEFGNGATTSSGVPVPGAVGLSVKHLYMGGAHGCALTTAGSTWCWGVNTQGQLGDGTATNRTTPVLVSGGLTFISLALGSNHSCGIVTDGRAYCWGLNGNGELGTGNTTSTFSPAPVLGGITFVQLTIGFNFTCGITGSGVAYCWGYNANGELGVGSTSAPILLPTPVAGGRTFSAITGRNAHTCGVPVGGGAPFCWGANNYGMLGNGSTRNASIPMEVVTPPIP